LPHGRGVYALGAYRHTPTNNSTGEDLPSFNELVQRWNAGGTNREEDVLDGATHQNPRYAPANFTLNTELQDYYDDEVPHDQRAGFLDYGRKVAEPPDDDDDA
jgi:hypothetical protein